ncbi:hypothetical protein LX32DRAFT_210058 [Colletotrichum zoysiae]|uniref:Uncharacterized protein n=1 Tax=Colletotrichum zoysiae TaxID=1216348 RepID=A0AAD9HQ20_9PEZI|nr:hypothetical protein LX32DRAFT_210058 [Colletotrichum zoysiae]
MVRGDCSAPNGLAGHDEHHYFTPDYKVSKYYAACEKRSGFTSSIWILSIAIPNSSIEQMNSPEVQRLCWPILEWKELGWNCRQSRIFPRNLGKYKLAALVIGTNADRPNSVYQRIKSHRSVILDCVPKVDSFNPIFF